MTNQMVVYHKADRTLGERKVSVCIVEKEPASSQSEK